MKKNFIFHEIGIEIFLDWYAKFPFLLIFVRVLLFFKIHNIGKILLKSTQNFCKFNWKIFQILFRIINRRFFIFQKFFNVFRIFLKFLKNLNKMLVNYANYYYRIIPQICKIRPDFTKCFHQIWKVPVIFLNISKDFSRILLKLHLSGKW